MKKNIFINKIIKPRLCFFAALFSLGLHADGTIITTTEESPRVVTAAGFEAALPQDAVWHAGNSTYMVWVDAKFRPWVTQTTNGVSNTVPIDALTDYTVQPDGHGRFSIGVDSQGYVHVTGDMHGYIDATTGTVNPYPLRYQKQIILYWKSNNPNDISAGFTFAGGSTATAIPGGGWNGGHFFADNVGTLYYTSMVHAFEALNNFGQQAVGLYRYDVTSQAWTSIGAIAPYTTPFITHIKPVFFWELSGFLNTFFQNYQPSFSFDKNNVMHFAVSANTNPNVSYSNRIVYAESPDNGATWRWADGKTMIAGFPIRGIDGLANSAQLVEQNTTGYQATVDTITDTNGTTAVGTVDYPWLVWSNASWNQNTTQNIPNSLPAAVTGFRMPDNSLAFSISAANKMLFTKDLNSPLQGYDFTNYTGYTNLDATSLLSTGTLYGVGLVDSTTQVALKTTITQAPLPTAWNGQDIDTFTAGYGGNSGYQGGHFIMTTYGQGFDANTDSFHYTYGQMSGDGTITARVNMPTGYSRAGVMMRESLDPTSVFVGQFAYPTPDGITTTYISRATANTNSIGVSVTGGVTALPLWVRLERSGNSFTGFVSQDGNTWAQTLSNTITMANTVYVGLAAASYTNYYYMLTADFDNVSSPVPLCSNLNPTVTFSPTTVSGAAGSNVNLIMTVTNNDETSCPSSTFNLSASIPEGVTGSLSASTLTLAPAASGSMTLSATSAVDSPTTNYTLQASATSSTNNTLSAQASATYSVTSTGCVLQAPTLQFIPTTRTTTGINAVQYYLVALSNDSMQCPTRLLRLSTDTAPYGIALSLEPYNLVIQPNQLAVSIMTATPIPNLKPGSFSVGVVEKPSNATATGTLVLQ